MTEARTRQESYFQGLVLRDFTCFAETDFEFVPGVNVFVGENGTGKTQAMKVLYSFLLHATQTRDISLAATFSKVMPTQRESDLVRLGSVSGRAEVKARYGSRTFNEAFSREVESGPRLDVDNAITAERPVFIPATDMMAHTKGFINYYDEYPLDFDYTFRDIVQLLGIEKREPAREFGELIAKLEAEVLQGTVEYDPGEQRFYLVRRHGRQPMPLVAEGLRKISTLLVLVRNGSIRRGRVLFWDEPEVNLNPIYMDEVVASIVALARSGVQVFLASHSYLILKELEVQSKEGEVRFFSFAVDGEFDVRVRPASTYLEISPNKIEEQYADLYDRQIDKEIAAVRAGASL